MAKNTRTTKTKPFEGGDETNETATMETAQAEKKTRERRKAYSFDDVRKFASMLTFEDRKTMISIIGDDLRAEIQKKLDEHQAGLQAKQAEIDKLSALKG